MIARALFVRHRCEAAEVHSCMKRQVASSKFSRVKALAALG